MNKRLLAIEGCVYALGTRKTSVWCLEVEERERGQVDFNNTSSPIDPDEGSEVGCRGAST